MADVIIILTLVCSPEGHQYISDVSQGLACTGPDSILLTADFNNDGRSDWFCNHLDTSQKDYYALATIAGTFYQKFDAGTEMWCPRSYGKMMTGDVNGDGMADLICRHADGEKYDVSYYERHKFSPSTKMHVSFKCDYSSADLLIGDINADNVDDFICVNKASGAVTVLHNYHHHRSRRHYESIQEIAANDAYYRGFQVPIEFCVGTAKTIHLADLNGDGAKDLVCHELTAGKMTYMLANRFHGFSQPITVNRVICQASNSVNSKFVVEDFDGDNHADLCCYDVNRGHRIITTDFKLSFSGSLSPGNNVVPQCANLDRIQYADVNGDRRVDAICNNASGNPPLEILYNVCYP